MNDEQTYEISHDDVEQLHRTLRLAVLGAPQRDVEKLNKAIVVLEAAMGYEHSDEVLRQARDIDWSS